jgi:hypothetical protein
MARPAVQPTASDVLAEWRIFNRRVSLLAHPSVGISLLPGVAWKKPEIEAALYALLYINLVSLFDRAMATQMRWRKYRDLASAKLRAKYLRDDLEKLIGGDAVLDIIDRRNDLGHGIGPAVSRMEFDRAYSAIKGELVAWGVVPDEPLPETTFSMTPERMA